MIAKYLIKFVPYHQTNSTKTINEPSEIPETYFIIIAIIVFIKLLSEIKKAEVGPMEFELKEDIIL
jgi:hypothetical protein